jgi:RNA polymerase sigma factor (sigma-70 family)
LGKNEKHLKTETAPKNPFRAAALEKSDAELLLACRAGDETAWNALVERFQRLVAAIPRRAGLSEDLTAEVFQEVFLALFEKLDSIEQPERLRAWLVTTAKFKTWRIVSKEKISQTAFADFDETEETNFDLPDDAPLPDALLIELEEQHLVLAAVNNLDERCRIMLQMLYLDENPASYAEVARTVNVNETSVSPLRARCLKKMLKLLTK